MSVPESSVDRQIPRHVDATFATIGEPVRYSSLFYALLYAVDVEGAAQAAFDYNRVRDLEARGFFWYGVATITSEMSHVDDRYFIDGNPITALRGDPDSVGGERDIADHVEGLAADSDLSADDIFEVFNHHPRLWHISEPGGMTQVFQRLQLEFNAVAEPMGYVRLIRDLFEAMPSTNAGPDISRSDGRTGWPVGYDGRPWVGICEHLLRRDSLSDTAFVDQSWSIEHNNRRWVDKITFTKDPDENEAIVDVLDLQKVDDPRAQELNDADYIRAVEDVLDAARDGDIERLYEWAVWFTDDVDVNLRRLALEFGVR